MIGSNKRKPLKLLGLDLRQAHREYGGVKHDYGPPIR